MSLQKCPCQQCLGINVYPATCSFTHWTTTVTAWIWLPILPTIRCSPYFVLFCCICPHSTVNIAQMTRSRWTRPSVQRPSIWSGPKCTRLVWWSQTTQMSKSSSSQQRHSVELMVSSSTHSGTVLPMSWERGLCYGRDVEEQTSILSRSQHLNKAASDEIAWHCMHYTGRGVMKFYESGAAFAQDMGASVSKMEKSIEAHYQASLETAKDPDGGPFPAYPSGKSWDEASGKTGSGKGLFFITTSFRELISQHSLPSLHASDPFCMWCFEIDENSSVLN